MNSVVTKNLTKKFGMFVAVENVNLDINEGEIYALIGPNGAGKTTLLKMLTGLMIPTSGTAAILGYDIQSQPVSAKANFGYMPDDPSAYDYLTGSEFLAFTGRLRQMTSDKLNKRISQLTPMFPVSDILNQPMSQYSRGNKQKIVFMSCLLTQPKLLIIDEPIVGLDSVSIDIMGRTLNKYTNAGNSVIFVTHILEFAQKYATRAGIMQKGKIIKEIKIDKTTKLNNII